jgi:hypothetical protein
MEIGEGKEYGEQSKLFSVSEEEGDEEGDIKMGRGLLTEVSLLLENAIKAE